MPLYQMIPASYAPKKILIIKLRHHGDMLLTTPVIEALHHHYPEASIDILLYQETYPMLEAHPLINRLHCIDRRWKQAGIWSHMRHEVALAQTIRGEHYDLVINLADQWRSALLCRFSGAPVRIGFDYEKRRGILWRQAHTHLVPTQGRSELHTVEQNLAALLPLGIAGEKWPARMHFHDSDQRQVSSLLAEQCPDNKPYIVIQPTSRWVYKCWDDDKMAALIDNLSLDQVTVILTSAPDKKELAMIDSILSLCHHAKPVSLAGKLSLPQLAALIDNARLFIGVDSAPMHMAAALNTPCIALFGPTKVTQWRPWGENNQVIWAGDYTDLPPPNQIDTKTKQRYLSAIPVGVVTDAARGYLHG